MIGLVIVSHSAKLAEGVCELANQMTQGQVPLAAAGGIDDPENPIGTDAFRIKQAIESVYSEAGVIVLMDMGSALLSAETALEFLSEEQRGNVRLCEAPLVEGAVAAAVQAMANPNIEQVLAEARNALLAKTAQLHASRIVPDIPLGTSDTAASSTIIIIPTEEIFLTIHTQHGLHARPAARFVGTAGRFQADITVRNVSQNTAPVNAKSINQVTTLGARRGHEIALAAQGVDAAEALVALQALVEANFGEPETLIETLATPSPIVIPSQSSNGKWQGIPASPGIAIGPVAHYRLTSIEVPEHAIDNPAEEWTRLQTAIQAAQRDIEALKQQAMAQVGANEAAIFDAHHLFLSDPALVETAREQIFEQSINAEAAWQRVIGEMVSTYQALEDVYLQARAADVADVGQRVLRWLTGATPTSLALSQPAILVATDLAPSDTAQLDPNQVLGLCVARGSATAHSAILARSLGIPAVVGMGEQVSNLSEGTLLALDGEQGWIWVEPDPVAVSELQSQRKEWLAAQQAAQVAAWQPALTRDGQQVEVVANIGGLAEVQAALDNGAEGVGLLRTEFLYLSRTTPPSEEEQYATYQAIAEKLGPRPLIIRTLDIGGDKPLPYVDLGNEANPFLGWRGIRFCLDQPDLFKTQLRAILRASPGHHLKLMFPMVSAITEIRAAKAMLAEVQTSLREAGIPFAKEIEVGIMVEVPAVVAIADQMAKEVDFFSIGTNDLSQYTTAADRTNARVAALADPFHPAVLRLIHQTIEAAHAAGIWVGLCGEFAGQPLATPLLLGLGLDEFSMSAPAIPTIKQTIRGLSKKEATTIAQAVLNLDSAEAVQQYLRSFSV